MGGRGAGGRGRGCCEKGKGWVCCVSFFLGGQESTTTTKKKNRRAFFFSLFLLTRSRRGGPCAPRRASSTPRSPPSTLAERPPGRRRGGRRRRSSAAPRAKKKREEEREEERCCRRSAAGPFATAPRCSWRRWRGNHHPRSWQRLRCRCCCCFSPSAESSHSSPEARFRSSFFSFLERGEEKKVMKKKKFQVDKKRRPFHSSTLCSRFQALFVSLYLGGSRICRQSLSVSLASEIMQATLQARAGAASSVRGAAATSRRSSLTTTVAVLRSPVAPSSPRRFVPALPPSTRRPVPSFVDGGVVVGARVSVAWRRKKGIELNCEEGDLLS